MAGRQNGGTAVICGRGVGQTDEYARHVHIPVQSQAETVRLGGRFGAQHIHCQESAVVLLRIKAVPQAHGKQRQLKKFAPYAALADLHLGQEPAVGGRMVINGKNQRRKIHRRFKRGGHDGMNISVPVKQIAPLRTVHKRQIRQFRFCAVHKKDIKIGAPGLEPGTFRSQSGRPTIGPCPVFLL